MNPPPKLGVNFSHRHAAWLGLDPDRLLRELLDDLGVRQFRISVYWDEVAPAADQLDFTPLRRWLDPLEERGAHALITLGLKAQRWPEFYPPSWLTDADSLPNGTRLAQHPRVVAHLLLMLERMTAFLADYDAIDSWQVENEPWLPGPGKTVGWRFSPALVAREIAVVREADPRRRPIVVNHSSQNRFDRRWQHALALADVIAENVYTRRPNRWPWPRYFNVHALGPYAPALATCAAETRRYGKEWWITELQAEPWEALDMQQLTPEEVQSITPTRLADNLHLVTAAGAARIYLWGAEWWRFTANRDGDTRFWNLAHHLFGEQRQPTRT